MKKGLFGKLFGREPESPDERIKKLQQEIEDIEKRSLERKTQREMKTNKGFVPGRRVFIKNTSMYAAQAGGCFGILTGKPHKTEEHSIQGNCDWVEVSFPSMGGRKNTYPVNDLVFEDQSDFENETLKNLFEKLQTL